MNLSVKFASGFKFGAHGTVGAAAVPPPGNAFVGPSPSPRYGGHSDPDLISGL